jgi:putative transposase
MPIICGAIEKTVYEFISAQLREQGCPVRIINGMPDHVHCLFLLSPQKSIAEVIKQIKGSSSHRDFQGSAQPVWCTRVWHQRL